VPFHMGIDIGSKTSKGAIIQLGRPLAYHLVASGFDYGEIAQKLRAELLSKAVLSQEKIAATAATGHGAGIVSFSSHQVSDIRCCARGINSVFPFVRTVIDVQGMSTQVIRLNENGRVTNFAVTEKCAAGSGRSLDIVANVLRVDLKDIGSLSLKSRNPVMFSTGCAVFGESEAVSRVAEGASKEDILAGVHEALANKISTLVDRVGLEMDCAISGGGALNIALIKSLEKKLGILLPVPAQPQFINALGAAIMAEEMEGGDSEEVEARSGLMSPEN